MTWPDAKTLSFIDQQVTTLIGDKYGLSPRDALRRYLDSETYRMVLDKETLLYRDSPLVAFDLWEAEQVTGDPRNSVYVRAV